MGSVLDFYNEYNNSDWLCHDIPENITNRYEIKACLKMNEDKQVYLVTSKTNWKKYVLKALASQCHESLEEEYKLSRELSHPGIVTAVEYIEGTDYNYLIRDYVEGNTVSELVEMTEAGHLQNEELQQITLQLCDILQYLHTQKPPIIHRDIKPDNIIITKQNECKLIDFGISRRYQGKGDSDTFVMGTQFSAPPEQYGFAQTNERSDIYSIGVLMFFMASGSMNIKELKQSQIQGDIRRIIMKCTRFAPKDRYASVKQLKYKLVSYPLIYKKRGVLYAGGIAVAATVLMAGLFLFLAKRSLSEEAINVTSGIDTNQYDKVIADNSSEPTINPSATEVNEIDTEQAVKNGNTESAAKKPTELSASGITVTVSEENEAPEELATASAPSKTEPEENTVDTSDRASEGKAASNAASQAQEQMNTLQETEDEPSSTTVVLEEQVYNFKSPLIEAAVREQLGRAVTDTVMYKDLEQITSLLICGQQRYERWEEHFVYGVNQHMIGSQYEETQLYKINGEITSLEDISCMVNLEKLALYNQKITDLTPPKELHYLSYLGLGRNNINDLTPVTKMDSLSYLDLSGNPIMNDELEKLKELPYLWGLDLGATKVTSVYGIKDLKLNFLSLFECKMGDCIGLEELKTLDNLILTGVNNAITKEAIDRVAKLTNLKILKIFGSDRIDLSKFSSLKSLYLLDLCGMWNSSYLGDLSNPVLSQLYFDACQKLDLTGIEKLPGVEVISLRNSICSDYLPLLGVKTLKKVYCNMEQQKIIKEQLGEVPFEIIVQ